MKVTIAGCGIVGATIAYELSKIPTLEVLVLDQRPETASPIATGAALGVLMGVISQKEKGNNLRMRLFSIQYYERIIPELEALTGIEVPFNRHGILMLQFDQDLSVWEKLVEVRRVQGWRLEILGRDRLAQDYPQLSLNDVSAGIYSAQDRQVNPTILTQALIAGARKNGATFQFETTVTEFTDQEVQTDRGAIATEALIIAAGIGSDALVQDVEIRPVLGQAIQVRTTQALGLHEPVITGNDVHIVPLGQAEYWIGATVEFEPEKGLDLEQFEAVNQQAIALCPALAHAETIRTWSGLRPRPQGRPAPVIEPVAGYSKVWLASGHYRNGVLLAPATAEAIKTALNHL
jgi:glycine oxidase